MTDVLSLHVVIYGECFATCQTRAARPTGNGRPRGDLQVIPSSVSVHTLTDDDIDTLQLPVLGAIDRLDRFRMRG